MPFQGVDCRLELAQVIAQFFPAEVRDRGFPNYNQHEVCGPGGPLHGNRLLQVDPQSQCYLLVGLYYPAQSSAKTILIQLFASINIP